MQIISLGMFIKIEFKLSINSNANTGRLGLNIFLHSIIYSANI